MMQPQLALRPAAAISPPTEYRRMAAIGWVAIALTFGGALAWSTLAPVSAALMAPGTVVVDGQRTVVEHLKGGYVSELHVREGERVAANQLLMTLSDADTAAELATLRERRRTNGARVARLLAERDGLETIAFPEGLRMDRGAREAIDAEMGLFEARRAKLYGEVDLLRSRHDQARAEIGRFRERQEAGGRQLRLVEEELTGVRQLYKQGYATASRVRELEQQREALRAKHSELTMGVEQTQGAIAAAMLELLQLERRFNEEVQAELDAVRRESRELEEQLRAVAEDHERLVIRAPVAGVVVDLAVSGPGAVIKPAERVLDIVPEEDRLVVEARVPPAEVNGLRTGLRAEVRVQKPDGSDVVSMVGEVSMVSGDRLVDPQTGAPYFLVRVMLEESGGVESTDVALMPGLPVEILVLKGERTALSYLTGPLSDLLIRAFRE
ncbi:MAG TPA: HlyD family type I secretion periplasmic adaptor subunit [Pseudonocardiaceae bacterium]|nr:HlyD family type I secretion periplasmic adaptor subunit [Pseudonocardiaceae bacterium]